MRLAYIISAYKNPSQLTRLINRLDDEGTTFLVHVDRKAPEEISSGIRGGLSGFSNVRFLPRHRCYWGGFGHVRATLEGIDEICHSGLEYDYAILLTGQDYPIKPNAAIRRYLADHNGAAFLDHFPLPHEAWEGQGLDRIDTWHFRILDRHVSLRWLPIRRGMPYGYRPFGGSSYWCLPPDAVRYVYDEIRRRPELLRFFEYVDVPDELFFQTILLNSPLNSMVVNDNLRYIQWRDPDSGSPTILRASDYPEFAMSPKLFARKFDVTVDEGVLDLIDREILGYCEKDLSYLST